METIQVKTIDPLSQDLLRSAFQRGIILNWDRYEKQQPQDGFLRLGLSCPYGCMQGPCRLDPFGRGPERGLCGLSRDEMVAALLLRLTLFGALEAMAGSDRIEELTWAPPLGNLVSRAVKNLGGQKISTGDLVRSASFLNRPMASPDSLILQALRLSILTLGWLAKKTSPQNRKKGLNLKVGYGLLAQKEINIGVCGQLSPDFLQAIQEELSNKGQLVSLGDWILFKDKLLPLVCSSGETELVLTSGRINLLLGGPGTDLSLIELCRALNIPLILTQDLKAAKEALLEIKPDRSASSPMNFNPPPSLMEEAEVVSSSSKLEEIFEKERTKKLAFLGGDDHLYHPLGWIPTEVTPALQGKGFSVAGWGDAALWMIKKGLASPKSKTPVKILDGCQGPILALKALGGSGRLKDLTRICFTGMKCCQDLAVALGLAALGLRVSVAIPLPLWGSERVRILLQEKLAALSGSLTHFDHPADAQEILDWFIK